MTGFRCGICDEPITGDDLAFATYVDDEHVHLDCLRGERSSGPDTLITGPPRDTAAGLVTGSADPRDTDAGQEGRIAPASPEQARLDAEMQELVLQLMMCSHVPAAPWQPTGRSRSSDEHPGGGRPPGDLGPEVGLSAAYDRCETDEDRRRVIGRARDALKEIRGHLDLKRADGETEEQRIKRMLKETVNLSPEQVATTNFRMSPTLVRRHRSRAGLDPEKGTELVQEDLDADGRRERAQSLEAEGFSLAYIARKLGVSRSTVERDLERRAA